MPDREKVIRGLECCKESPDFKPTCKRLGCPYYEREDCIAEMADDALTLLKSQQARIAELEAAQTAMVMTLEELEHAEIAYAEDVDKTDIIPVLVLGRMCDSLDLVKPHVDKNATTRMICPRVDEYGKRWRCWTSRPTDAQREATPWV